MFTVSAGLPHGRRPVRAATRSVAAAVSAAAIVAAAGCSSGPAGGPGSTGNTGTTGTSGTGGTSGGSNVSGDLPPRQALKLALQQSQRDTSAVGTVSVQVSGTSNSTSTGVTRMRFKPHPMISSTMRVRAASGTISIDEIEAGSTLYLKMASLSATTGKPWAAVTSPAVAAGAGGVGQQGLPNPLQQAELLYLSGHIRSAGTQVIGGTRMARYQGSYSASAALKGLPPATRKKVGGKVRGSIQETVWIDGQHQLRRLVTVEQVSAETLTITVDITAINVPVRITVPPASQVAPLPAGALAGR